ncbi:TetR/AcrR family transcriptional regulator [Levilactobacillus andaensis]|uniref:TetR/AcrR family transcriptional regulator n=1 Tax=Levilactobacillus andaensis TaxID=2799570 RepID=UPI00194471E5|nr:TetR/AcrR family transcriptional regulator [Levilactobacillus andaensis]
MTTDLRVVKTKETIKRGFLACIDKQYFSKLTIAELTNEMKINKSTFYNYYEDKYDLRLKLIESALESFSNSIDVSYLKLTPSQIQNYEQKLPTALLPLFKQRATFLTLWSPKLESNVFEQMENIFVKKFFETLPAATPGENSTQYQELHARLFAASAMQVIKWWFEVSPTTTVAEVSKIIAACLASGTYVAFNSPTRQTD